MSSRGYDKAESVRLEVGLGILEMVLEFVVEDPWMLEMGVLDPDLGGGSRVGGVTSIPLFLLETIPQFLFWDHIQLLILLNDTES